MSWWYRVKQFYWSVTAKFTKEDYQYIRSFLDQNEQDLFYQLSTSEQKHSIKVAQDIEIHSKIEGCFSEGLMKVALLHDIGKIRKRLSPIDKSIIVLLHRITRGHIEKWTKVDKIDVYYHHGRIGYELLKDGHYNEKVLYLVKNHHNHRIMGNKELELLRDCDSKN